MGDKYLPLHNEMCFINYDTLRIAFGFAFFFSLQIQYLPQLYNAMVSIKYSILQLLNIFNFNIH